MGVKGRISVAALSALAMAGPAGGDTAEGAQRLTLAYNGSILGLRVVKASIEAQMDEETYSASAVFRSAGLVGFFKTAIVDSHVRGARLADGFAPLDYHHVEDMGTKRRAVTLDYRGETVQALIDPPFGDMGFPPADEAQKREALDPVSAILSITYPTGANPCEGRTPVFDSKLRYDLVFTAQGREDIRTRGYRGPAYRCQVFYEPLAGYDAGEIDENADIYRTPITVWLADLGDGVTAPVRIAARFHAGRLPVPVRVEASRIERG